MSMTHLEAMFEHHLWANLRLLEFCADQEDAVLDAPKVEGTFDSVRETWVHVLANEQGYLHEMKPVADWITIEPAIFAERSWKGFDHLIGVAKETGEAPTFQIATAARSWRWPIWVTHTPNRWSATSGDISTGLSRARSLSRSSSDG